MEKKFTFPAKKFTFWNHLTTVASTFKKPRIRHENTSKVHFVDSHPEAISIASEPKCAQFEKKNRAFGAKFTLSLEKVHFGNHLLEIMRKKFTLVITSITGKPAYLSSLR